MRSTLLKLLVAVAVAIATTGAPAAAPPAETSAAPAFQSIGPLTFAADGLLFAADVQAASIYALDLGAAANGGAAGAKAIPNIDKQIAALLGTDVREIAVTDLAVHPKTHNAFVSVMRGQGAGAKAVLLRVDGAGKIDIVDLSKLKATHVMLPNPPSASGTAARGQAITDMAFMDGRLYVAGLSNEEF